MAEIPVLTAAPPAAPGGKTNWLLILFVALIAAVGAGGSAWWYFTNYVKPAIETEESKLLNAPPIFVKLDPPFVVNFEAEQLVRFLQVTVEVMSRDPLTADILKTNDPIIRNDLLMLFGNQQYATIATREGKEKLRADALNVVRRVVAGANGGKPARVEAVYFTSFVMQ